MLRKTIIGKLIIVLGFASVLAAQPAENFMAKITTELEKYRTEMNRIEQAIANIAQAQLENQKTLEKILKLLPSNETDDLEEMYQYHKPPTDCSGALHRLGGTGRIIELKPHKPNAEPFQADCKVYDGKGWTIIQRRQDGKVDFFRNWDNYTHGFGNVGYEYWLGLERIHALTSKTKFELLIEMITHDGQLLFARYSEFAVGDESEGFKLKVNGYKGNAGNAMSYSNEQKFSTFDMDNDENEGVNCADSRKSAWWFKGCTLSNINGEYKPYSDENKTFTGLWWWPGKDPISLQFVHMAISPV